MPNRKFRPTPSQHKLVEALLVYGIPLASVCRHIINPNTGKAVSYVTLVREFAEEIATAVDEGNAKVASNLYRIATAKNSSAQTVTAAIFWMRTRGGWKVADAATPILPPGQEAPAAIGSEQAAQQFIDEALARYGRRRSA